MAMVGLYLCIWFWRRMRMIVSHTSLLINLASPRANRPRAAKWFLLTPLSL